MRYMELGSSGIQISKMGLGTWAIGGGPAWSGGPDEDRPGHREDPQVVVGGGLDPFDDVARPGQASDVVGRRAPGVSSHTGGRAPAARPV